MKLTTRIAHFAIAGAMALGLASNVMAADKKTTNTILGAGLGAAAGAVFSEGDPMLTLGGAAAGGVLGHVLTEDRKYKDNRGWRGSDRKYRRGNDNYRHVSHKHKYKHNKKRHHRR
ncbi:hypothetical protein L1889_07000 [Paenalcaligenes niemegkensis]|uniref:hypothetical protein n=1 Tax=Paenalcaligenes niemegkensis TaxID=2895469 RepID=UPI001EE8C5FA|nr:hypothetical protein [Paenalcaligenes niemegkensis]MCQ9616486.1 hypothetical protein [Paenalcaligenes niemegkensis]